MSVIINLYLLLLTFVSSINYFVDQHANSNNIYGAIDDPDSSNEWVTLLGVFNTIEQCINACVNNSTENNRCETYTWHHKNFVGGWALHCYGRIGYPLWTPIIQNNVDSGRIIWKCKSDMDCFLNGKCNTDTGNCTCNTAYSGPKCDILNLLPATKNTGYNITETNGKKISSWGGAVVSDDDDKNESTKYHMFLAQFDNNCGVNSWELNSIVVHAQSTNALNGPFTKVETIHHAFAHEPDIIRGPNGEYVIYYVAFNYTGIKECDCSTPGDGSTTDKCQNRLPYPAEYITIMQYAASLDGMWSEEIVVFPLRTEKTGLDTNLAGVILPNGTFTGLMRIWDDNTAGSEIHLATATNWKDGSTYKQHSKVLFPELVSVLTEDPFLYVDCDGYYHAIFHNMSPNNLQQVCGGHAYSQNGVDWIYSGYIYNNIVEFTDGTSFTYDRRERPHFVFAKDGCTPIALSNGVQYGGRYGDATFTLVQPIKN